MHNYKLRPNNQSQDRDTIDLRALLERITIGEPGTSCGLQVFPLAHPNRHDPEYVLIDDLLTSGKAEIAEHGTVPTIRVLNRSDADVLILDGMELRGAKQNRMVNVTIVVGKHMETEIPVSCVEQGRWSYRSTGFRSAKRTVASQLRRS